MKRTLARKLEAEVMSELLGAILVFMAKSGVSLDEISKIFGTVVRANFHPSGLLRNRAKSGLSYGCDTVAGAVLRAWHRNSAYLDAAARPMALELDEGELSLMGLVRSQCGSDEPAKVIGEMRRAGLIRKVGKSKYAPVKESATIGSIDPLAIDHVAKTVIRLVETASRNMAGGKGKISLIERYAHVPDLSDKEAVAFATFSRHQGQACLDAVEDWLEARQVGSVSARGGSGAVNAGVHVFAFLGQSKEGAKRKSTKPQKEHARRNKSGATGEALA